MSTLNLAARGSYTVPHDFGKTIGEYNPEWKEQWELRNPWPPNGFLRKGHSIKGLKDTASTPVYTSLPFDARKMYYIFFCNAGALITRIGFWGPLYYIIVIVIRNPQNSIGDILGPFIEPLGNYLSPYVRA